ncbi:MAG: dipeptidase PepE [Planctomycetota bacterium]
MRNLLLVSNSTQHGYEYLDHCGDAMRELFAGCSNLLFVPYALYDLDAYGDKACQTFASWGLNMKSIHTFDDPAAAVMEADGVFVGGGNTFRLTKKVHESGVGEAIQQRALQDGMPYAGTSAGSNLACWTIRTTNDMPIVYPSSFNGLQLVPFQINAHYQDPDPDSTHMGETREQRIKEFHEENPQPVIGLREGAWLQVQGDKMTLQGTTGAKLFTKDAAARELATGADLSDLL